MYELREVEFAAVSSVWLWVPMEPTKWGSFSLKGTVDGETEFVLWLDTQEEVDAWASEHYVTFEPMQVTREDGVTITLEGMFIGICPQAIDTAINKLQDSDDKE